MNNEDIIRERSAVNPSGSLFGCTASRILILAAARARQPLHELARKAHKARRRQNIWTVEELDFAAANANEIAKAFDW